MRQDQHDSAYFAPTVPAHGSRSISAFKQNMFRCRACHLVRIQGHGWHKVLDRLELVDYESQGKPARASTSFYGLIVSRQAFHSAAVCAFLAMRQPSDPMAQTCLVGYALRVDDLVLSLLL